MNLACLLFGASFFVSRMDLARVVYGDYLVRLATPDDHAQLVGDLSQGVYGGHDYYPRVAATWLASAPLPSVRGVLLSVIRQRSHACRRRGTREGIRGV